LEKGLRVMFGAAFQATAFQNNAFQIGTAVEPIPPFEGGGGAGGGSRAYRRRLREAIARRRVFEEERARRIAAIGRDPLTMERPPLKPAPETVTMLKAALGQPERVLWEPVRINWPQPESPLPAPQQEDDGGEEELLLLLLAD
jgi:hypothetical protein